MKGSDRSKATAKVSTGIDGFDGILDGGYASNRVHLVEGQPGTGKTTLALQFLMRGVAAGERCLYITLSESKEELEQVAETHGWDLGGIDIFELVPAELSLDPQQRQTVVYASDLELGETTKMTFDEVKRVTPSRVVFDSLSEIRLLAQNPLRYRRQVIGLKHFFAQQGCTTLFLDDLTEEGDDQNLHSLVHGVIRLEHYALQYGAERRRMRVFKMRGRSFRGGYHDFLIRKGGIALFPRLVAAEYADGQQVAEPILSGIAELDQLLGGGLDRGTSTLLMGPSGSGKSSIAMQFVMAALRRGERALFVTFDETKSILNKRAAGMGWNLAGPIEGGQLILEQVDPAELSPGELTGMVRRLVEVEGVRIVVLDSLSGYQNAMPAEQFMLLLMHETLTYLNHRGVVTILTLAQHGLIGPMQSSVDLTYLSDTVLLLRFFEAAGKIRRAISVLKKRTGRHEDEIREYRLDDRGITVGPPLSEFQGVLSGSPTYTGQHKILLGKSPNGAA
ncbi:ATPase domain-containing protein [Bradyrhizobium sp. CW11]|uniref:ATPase domain-containing protein n=1 Tax=Bradyrhizobium sp. CW11 TaxID=2782684 RepID=UPI001FF86E46|nr:ATPase domain-containing protein [Bradyrhizobium sp. CW11]MCK1344488.1 AAA family ATPase [Bradyrhizobium sp. CW11]